MKNCPYCDGWINDEDQSISLVETHVNNFENSQAAECDHCGLRAMSANIEDGDEQAFTFWDNLVDSINNTAAELERYETARQEDARRLEQVKGERDAMREALELAKSLIYQHHEISHIRRANENPSDKCEACGKNGQLKKLFDAAALKDAK